MLAILCIVSIPVQFIFWMVIVALLEPWMVGDRL